MAAQLIALIVALAAGGQRDVVQKWATVTPPGAGFTIQGDYDLNFKSPDRTTGRVQKLVIILAVSVMVIAGGLWYLRRRHRQLTSKR